MENRAKAAAAKRQPFAVALSHESLIIGATPVPTPRSLLKRLEDEEACLAARHSDARAELAKLVTLSATNTKLCNSLVRAVRIKKEQIKDNKTSAIDKVVYKQIVDKKEKELIQAKGDQTRLTHRILHDEATKISDAEVQAAADMARIKKAVEELEAKQKKFSTSEQVTEEVKAEVKAAIEKERTVVMKLIADSTASFENQVKDLAADVGRIRNELNETKKQVSVNTSAIDEIRGLVGLKITTSKEDEEDEENNQTSGTPSKEAPFKSD
jgi:hypothetical protein